MRIYRCPSFVERNLPAPPDCPVFKRQFERLCGDWHQKECILLRINVTPSRFIEMRLALIVGYTSARAIIVISHGMN